MMRAIVRALAYVGFALIAVGAGVVSVAGANNAVSLQVVFDQGSKSQDVRRFKASVAWPGPGGSGTYWIVAADRTGTVWPQLSGKLGSWAIQNKAELPISVVSMFPLKIYVVEMDAQAVERLQRGFDNGVYYITSAKGISTASNVCSVVSNAVQSC